MKIIAIFSLLVSSTCAFMSARTSPSRPQTAIRLQTRVEDAIADAQRICAPDPTSPACRVAWDIVEELEAAGSRKDQGYSGNVNTSPDYQALAFGFDMLLRKIDGKMDQLSATATKKQQMGSDNPALDELCQKAHEMKEAISRSRAHEAARAAQPAMQAAPPAMLGLPFGWIAGTDPATGSTYYQNNNVDPPQSQWDPPPPL
jgi:hypothetical protein